MKVARHTYTHKKVARLRRAVMNIRVEGVVKIFEKKIF